LPSRVRRTHDAFEDAGLIAGTIMRHPREFVALVMAAVATLTIVVNALFLQRGPHPAPLFAPGPATPLTQKEAALPPHRPLPAAAAAPAAEPAAPARSQAQIAYDIQRELRRHGYYGGTVDGIWGIKTAAAARDFLRAARLTLKPEPSEALLHALAAVAANAEVSAAAASDHAAAMPPENAPVQPVAPSKRLIAMQLALAEFGYGQIKPSGVFDDETRAAIENFQRAHKLPADGQPSPRFARELTAMTGRAFDE
jgi:peptidoglycan hydrolase-like protein with peptidoglycan-binding domain